MQRDARVASSDYEIVPYRPELKQQVIELQTHLWGQDLQLNAAYFGWKYERNPYVDTPLIYLAMQDGRAVGMRGFFGVQWEAGIPLQQTVAVYADDTVVAPECANLGLMPRIMGTAFTDLARREFEYVYSLSAGQVTFVSSLVMGWGNVGMVRPLRWRSWKMAARAGVRRLLAPAPWLPQWMAHTPARVSGSIVEGFCPGDEARRRLRGRSWIRLEDTPRCDAMAEIVLRIGTDGRLRHVRDRRYFEWRFQNPMRRYRFFYWEKERMEGYLVLGMSSVDPSERAPVNIVDCEASSLEIQSELLDAAMRTESSRDLVIWAATLPPGTVAMLERKGFRIARSNPGIDRQLPAVLVRATSPGTGKEEWTFAGQPLVSLANWDVRMLYSMHG